MSFAEGISPDTQSYIKQELADKTKIKPPLQQALGDAAFKKAMDSGKYKYGGNVKCRLCHRDFFVGRKQDVHDHAYEKLKKLTPEHSDKPRCLNCHSTGYGVNSGFENMQKTPKLSNVQCEGCHGPGSVHLQLQIVKLAKEKGLKKIQDKNQNKPPSDDVVLGGFLAGTDSPKILRRMCKACHTKTWHRAFHNLDTAYDSYKKAKPRAESSSK